MAQNTESVEIHDYIEGVEYHGKYASRDDLDEILYNLRTAVEQIGLPLIKLYANRTTKTRT